MPGGYYCNKAKAITKPKVYKAKVVKPKKIKKTKTKSKDKKTPKIDFASAPSFEFDPKAMGF